MTIKCMIDDRTYLFDRLNVSARNGYPVLQMIADEKVIAELIVSPGQTLSIDFGSDP